MQRVTDVTAARFPFIKEGMEATEVTKVRCLGGHMCDRNQPLMEETGTIDVVIMGAPGDVSMGLHKTVRSAVPSADLNSTHEKPIRHIRSTLIGPTQDCKISCSECRSKLNSRQTISSHSLPPKNFTSQKYTKMTVGYIE
ncbi:hypothetical protein PoB_005081900 [Plakobranchus ocellatus]|uniref:Uncharacterized protein n=1 Tax=Plakobranchus ocellatus TaxID=259542 RepID=A0AAV4C0W2_9GAST|nr:hypothetical protein PoB_005081900 [Plakobranchus ocellatus]